MTEPRDAALYRAGRPTPKDLFISLTIGPTHRPSGTLQRLMDSRAERCAEHERFARIDAAFRVGDLEALRAAVEDPSSIPNGPMPLAIGSCLEYAIYHSPLSFIRTLLAIGADPRPEDHIGFPPLIAALSCSRAQPGSPGRPDVAQVIKLLLAYGADPQQRGVNDYTALHMAVAERNEEAIALLLEAGADPRLPTCIDECESALEMAARAGLSDIERMMVSWSMRERHK